MINGYCDATKYGCKDRKPNYSLRNFRDFHNLNPKSVSGTTFILNTIMSIFE